jgi:hypothetical protein
MFAGRVTLGLGVALVGLGWPVLAANMGVVPKKLIVVDKLTAATKAKVVFVAKDTGVTKGAGEDVDQISVQFDVAYGNGSAAGAFTLPAGASVDKSPGWVVNKDRVAKYVNKLAPGGPTEAKVAVIKPTKLLKLVGKSLGDTPLDILGAGDPGASGVQTAYCVTNGGEEHCHCSAFTDCVYKSIAGGTGAKLVCKGGTGDPACSAVVSSTTTSTSTTTSSSTTTTSCVAMSGTFCDLGDGTVYDSATDLQWEQKDTTAGLHNWGYAYAWAGLCSVTTSKRCQPNLAAETACKAQTDTAYWASGCEQCTGGDGTCNVSTTVWDWVSQINAANFAGHNDWRLPSESGCNSCYTGGPTYSCTSCNDHELETILLSSYPCGPSPCIDSIFGPTASEYYWSSATVATSPTQYAWGVRFLAGNANGLAKADGYYVRAVRNGS